MTAYQKTHHPVRKLENKCHVMTLSSTGAGFCHKCSRVLYRAGSHNPNQTGSFGYTLYYADGSTRKTEK